MYITQLTDDFGREYVGSTLIGWKVSFCRGNAFRGTLPLQTRQFKTASRFSVLRQIIQEGRAWSGKVFYLEITKMDPIYHLEYDWKD